MKYRIAKDGDRGVPWRVARYYKGQQLASFFFPTWQTAWHYVFPDYAVLQ